jgi:hypothetical protein
MDKKILDELLNEIDNMSSANYWDLFRESQPLVEFTPSYLLDNGFVPIRCVVFPGLASSATFNTRQGVESLLEDHISLISIDEEALWPMAA